MEENFKIVLDTETCPIDATLEEVKASNMFVYDCGWAVVDDCGNVYRTRSYVNADIFLDEKALMKSAYYADKIPNYWKDIKAGKRILAKWSNIHKALLQDIKNYNITEIYAHNCLFDKISLNQTERWLTKSKYRFFLPYGIKVCDTLRMAKELIAPLEDYRQFCLDNGFMTNHKIPQVRLSAEVLYRYISGNLDFVEQHTGLEDVLIEKEILAFCNKLKEESK